MARVSFKRYFMIAYNQSHIFKALNTAECKAKQDIYDETASYIKSLCLVPRGNRYKVAEKYCLNHGMKLYTIDSTAALKGVLGFVRLRYANAKKRGFSFISGKAGDMCKTVNNFAGLTMFDVSSINCSDSVPSRKASGWFICEFKNPGSYILRIIAENMRMI